MPSYGFMSCVYSTEKISEAIGFPAFPTWLGKNSSERKQRRLIKEVKNTIFPSTLCSHLKATKFLHSPILLN